MLDLLKYLKETQTEEQVSTPDVLCLNCATVIPYSDGITECTHCGVDINLDKFNELYNYTCNALRYGHQYHEFYIKQKDTSTIGDIKPCLAELSDIYKYIALAITSGIIGGTSWELTKTAIRKIINQFEQEPASPLSRIEPTIDQKEIEKIAKNIDGYVNGVRHMEKEVAMLVFEEMNADSTRDYLDELIEIHKLLEKPKKKEKNRKRAIKLQKRLIEKVVMGKMKGPAELPVPSLWSDIER